MARTSADPSARRTGPSTGPSREPWPPRAPSSWSTTACSPSVRPSADARPWHRQDTGAPEVSSIAVIGPNAAADGHGRRQLGGDAASPARSGRGPLGATARALSFPMRSAAASTGVCRPWTWHSCRPGTRPRASPWSTSTTPTSRAIPCMSRPARLSRVMWLGQPARGPDDRFLLHPPHGHVYPDLSGQWRLGLESAGRSVLRLDGEIVVDNSDPLPGEGFYGAGSTLVQVERTLEMGRPYALQVDIWPRRRAASSWVCASPPGARTPPTSSNARWRPLEMPTSPWWWSAPTGSGSPRGGTGRTSPCRDASASWSRPSSGRTRARWSS